MSDKEISEKHTLIEDREFLTNKEITNKLERINSLYSNLTKNKDNEIKSPSSPSSGINMISPLTKAESNPLTKNSFSNQNQEQLERFEPNQLLSRKRHFKKINNNKKEISIKVVNCPSNFNMISNYSCKINNINICI